MRSLLLWTVLAIGGLAQSNLNEGAAIAIPDDDVVQKLTENGQCAWYPDNIKGKKKLTDDPCEKYCKGVGDSNGFGCESPAKPDPDDLSHEQPIKDDDGDIYVVGKCMCQCAVCGVIADFVVEALEHLDEVICLAFVSAIDAIAEVAIDLVPGGAEISGIGKIIKGAKSFYRNGQDAADFFGGWIAPACHVDTEKWNKEAFGHLVGAPDSMSDGKPLDCLPQARKAKKCRTLDPVPDPPKKGGDRDRDGNQPQNHSSKPKTTIKTDATKTTKDAPKTTISKHTKATSQTPATTKTSDSGAGKTTKTRKSTSTTTATATGLSCALCQEGIAPRNEISRYGQMYARANGHPSNNNEVCLLPDPEERSATSCKVDGSSSLASRALGTFGGFVDEHGLVARGKEVKTYKVPHPKGELIGSVGSYKQCGEAIKDDRIHKYFIMSKQHKSCSGYIEMVDAKGASGLSFETEHVFEPQTLSRFFKWLLDGKNIGTYKKPSYEWVSKYLLCSIANKNAHKCWKLHAKELGTAKHGDSVENVLGYGFGRTSTEDTPLKNPDRGPKNLLLLEDAANNQKGTWFRKGKPRIKYDASTAPLTAEGLKKIRNGAAAFRYMDFEYQVEEEISNSKPNAKPKTKTVHHTVWESWMRVSNWIDLVFYQFDEHYDWSKNIKGQPQNKKVGKNGQKEIASVRALWAYWIEDELEAIEKRAEEWSKAAEKKFDKKHPKPNKPASQLTTLEKELIAWRKEAFENKGFATPDKLKFPRPKGGPKGGSKYGAYAMKEWTLDVDDKKTALGVPKKVL